MKSISTIAMCMMCVCAGCVESFEIDPGERSDLIVIDALVTDCDSVQTVLIRHDKEDNNSRFERSLDAIEDVSVSIEDDNGWSAEFEDEDNRGREFTLSGHQFEPGRTYTITVRVGDRVFRATEKMVPLPEIDGIKFYAQTTKDDCTEFSPILYFKDNQPDVDNYYLINRGGARISYALGYVEIQRLSDVGLRGDLEGVVLELGMGAKWWYSTGINRVMGYCYSLLTISKSNYDYYGVMADQINNDGGIYKPTPTTPVTNFSGENVQGQFIAASMFEFSGHITDDIIVER